MGMHPPRRLVFIDALRGLAALSVFFFHAAEGHHLPHLLESAPEMVGLCFHHGNLGVMVFFVLSGFVIPLSIANYQPNLRFVGRFILRRSIRLDPPYWVSIGATILLAVISVQFVPGKSYVLPTWKEALTHLFYLQTLLEVPPINVAYWTLCFEVQFYIVYVLLACSVYHATKKTNLPGFNYVLWSATVVANLWPLGLRTNPLWPGVFLPQWYMFLAGVLVCRTYLERRQSTSSVATKIAFANSGFLMVVGYFRNDIATTTVAMTALTILLMSQREKLQTALGYRPLQLLGLISYSFYLFHNPISGAAFRIAYRLTGQSLGWELFWLVIVAGLNVAVAWLAWWMFERPSLILCRKLSLK